MIMKNENEKDSDATVENILADRMAYCKNPVLTSQLKRVVSNAFIFDKRNSLHNVLQQISRESLSEDSIRRPIVFEIPRKSVYTPEVIMQEYVFSNEKGGKLLADSFVQNLPVSIAEKRIYRKSISMSLKRTPWHTKLKNCLSKKWENFLSYFDLWHESLSIIEGQHGTAILSYFVFIRWLLYMNIIIFLLNFTFLVIPQVILPGAMNYTEPDSNQIKNNINSSLLKENKDLFMGFTNATPIKIVVKYCQDLYAQDISNDSRSDFISVIQSFLQGTGPLEPTHLFIGFYSPSNDGHTYIMPVAFLCIIFASFVTCYFMMAQYSSLGVQEGFAIHSKKSYFYSNEVFSAWEHCIKDPISADRLHYRIVFDLKTALDEDRSVLKITKRSTGDWIKLYSNRILINIFLLIWLIACCYLIYFVTVVQMREQQYGALSEPGMRTFLLQFLPSITLIILNSISPTVFKILESYEKYPARIESNLSIFRNLFLYLSSIIILLNTFYNQVACKAKDICGAGLDMTCRSPRCWETYIGQQLYKLTLTKIFVLIGVFIYSDVLRYWITNNYNNKFTRLWGAPAFSLPSEVLAAINSQTILWLGVFYSPLLSAVMIFKLILIFNLKKIKVLKLCAPKESSYRASKINSVFIFIMLISFFVVLGVQSYAIDSISPSRGCGPFRYFKHMTEAVPLKIRRWLSVLMSHWILMFIALILCFAMYYYWQIIASQKELVKRLKDHLVLQSYDKQFLLKSIAELKNKKQE